MDSWTAKGNFPTQQKQLLQGEIAICWSPVAFSDKQILAPNTR